MADDKEQLERRIFGGSDSELSSDEDQHIPKPPPVHRKSPKQQRPQDDYGSGSGSEEDDYEQQKRVVKKRPKPSRKSTEDKPTRKRKRRAPEPVDLSHLPESQAAKIRVDQKIDAILKPQKSNRQKKRKGEEVLDAYTDDQIARLRENMLNAADEDIMSNANKLPATAKLRMLPEVMETLRRFALSQSMIDNNLFEAVTRWLEPLRHDKSLPSLNIQREFFPILKRMDFIDTNVLKESGLGKIVMFYTKGKRVTPDIARIARELVDTWSRPIIKRSASFRDRRIPTVHTTDSMRQPEKYNSIMARSREADKDRVRKNAVSIPRSELRSYTVAPDAKAGIMRMNAMVDGDIERRRRNAEKIRSLTRKVTTNK
ncbi:TFIIS N-terminal domain-containing protein [Mycena indigotica]|uniref:TFIIS N-terminal domain-containing protein n=1 Tax=Mycena indigotica TaxID=2126181 RepID=A0A8H6T911_9AGAR|nr:TFIIS N-terminal domain-containing protein [Mycena indigotica]KAF7312431.1 TFIIS N-terminal domain-containing protein [Mycena indigotica]